MAKKTKEELAVAEAALLAEEQDIKKRWCALKGHRWDLPGTNPLNTDIWDCSVRCNRCNVTATLTIVLDKEEK